MKNHQLNRRWIILKKCSLCTLKKCLRIWIVLSDTLACRRPLVFPKHRGLVFSRFNKHGKLRRACSNFFTPEKCIFSIVEFLCSNSTFSLPPPIFSSDGSITKCRSDMNDGRLRNFSTFWASCAGWVINFAPSTKWIWSHGKNCIQRFMCLWYKPIFMAPHDTLTIEKFVVWRMAFLSKKVVFFSAIASKLGMPGRFWAFCV